MIATTLQEVAEITTGSLIGAAQPDAVVTGDLSIDSRTISPGGLFIARAGEYADGHDHVGAALAAGAIAAVVDHDVGDPAVLVADTEEALGQIARSVVDRVPGLVTVALTGSSGKTTTKDLLAEVLAARGPLVAPPGSYNTDTGVPLTVAKVGPDTATLVVEMGARGAGHITRLTRIAPPDVAVVLNVGSAHLGEFGGTEQIAAAKSELVAALHPDGVAVLNADDTAVEAMAGRAPGGVLRFGRSSTADVRAEQVRLDERARASFRLVTPSGSSWVRLGLVGEHQVSNSLAVAGVAHVLGQDVDDIAAALAAARPRSQWRMEVSERGDGLVVINDSYNSNPESARAALDALVAMAAGRRSWAVLGEMAELGDTSGAAHEALGRQAVHDGVDRVLAIGEAARSVHVAAHDDARVHGMSHWVPDIDTAATLLEEELTPGDVVLVKASRAVGLEHLVERVLQRGAS